MFYNYNWYNLSFSHILLYLSKIKPNAMKKMMKSLTVFALAAGTCFTFMNMTPNSGGRYKVYLQNKCSSDVSIRVESPGSATNMTIDDGTSKPDTFLEGTKIYDNDGKLVHTVSSKSEGMTIIVCD